MQNNKKLSLIPILVLSVILLQCQKNPTGPPSLKDYYPLAVGNFWLYANVDNTYKIRDEIIGFDYLADGSLVFAKRRISRYQSSNIAGTVTSYLRFVRDELREYPEKDCPLTYIILLKSPLQIGAKWKTGSGGDCLIAPISLTDTVTDIENITVPAGRFNDCFRIQFCPSPDLYCFLIGEMRNRWFAPYVGIVKWETAQFFGNSALTLREYRVP